MHRGVLRAKKGMEVITEVCWGVLSLGEYRGGSGHPPSLEGGGIGLGYPPNPRRSVSSQHPASGGWCWSASSCWAGPSRTR